MKKKYSKDELLKVMEDRVIHEVINYQTDFYDYDINIINGLNPFDKRIWITRDSGTHLLRLDRLSSLVVIDYYETAGNFYLIERNVDEYSLKRITYENAHKMVYEETKDIKPFIAEIQTGYYTDQKEILAKSYEDCRRILINDYGVDEYSINWIVEK